MFSSFKSNAVSMKSSADEFMKDVKVVMESMF